MPVFTKRIDSDIRDIRHQFWDAAWGINQGAANTVGNKSGSDTDNVGLRFIGVTIPKGSVINSAKITFLSSAEITVALQAKIQGIAEDNTGEFVLSPEDSARTRTKTSASVLWQGDIVQVYDTNLDTPDIKTIIQEIVNRSGWDYGNALAIYLSDNGSASGEELYFLEYIDSTSSAALLTVDYTVVSTSPSLSPSVSPSLSPSVSPSMSPSPGVSYSPSVSPSVSLSPSTSPSPSPSVSISPSKSPSQSPSISPSVSPEAPLSYGLKIKKPAVNKNVDEITDPKELVFTSAMGVLGLRLLGTITATTDEYGNIDVTYNHNIGYPPIIIAVVTAYSGNRVNLPVEWHSFYNNGLGQLMEVSERFSFSFTGVYINITAHAGENNHVTHLGADIVGREYVFKVYYYFNELVET